MPNRSRYPKTEDAKKLFMDSKFSTWAEFTDSMGWEKHATMVKYPVAVWVSEKARVRDSALATDIQGMLSDRAEGWWHQTNKTLREYPQSIDRVKALFDYKVNKMAQQAKLDSEGKPSTFDKIPVRDFTAMSHAIKALTDAKMQSLMIKDLQIKEFDVSAQGESKIVFELAGGQTPDEIRKVMKDWYNK